MSGIALLRRFKKNGKHRLLQPRHVREVAQILASLSSPLPESLPVRVSSTSLGIRISAGAAGAIHHYALSSQQEPLREDSARLLADLIRQLRHPGSSSRLVSGKGVFHLLVEGM